MVTTRRPFRSFLNEARRRQVAGTAAWYVVGTWAVIQVADVVGPALSLPAMTVRYLIYAAVAGLPVALVLAWMFDVRAPRVRRDKRRVRPGVAADMPASAEAYEFYVRANHIATLSSQWSDAAALYRQCLALDADFAPAWARLGRCERLIGKYALPASESAYHLDEAERCFQRALTLDPDLPLTHSLYAQFEIDTGKPEAAMVRLLARAAVGADDAEIFAGLVQACRFVGLLEPSLQAFAKARALDPGVRTGVAHTYFMLGRYEDALAEYRNADIGYLEALSLVMLDRSDEAAGLLRTRTGPALVGTYLGSLRALIEDRREDAIRLTGETTHTSLARDGEAMFYMARQFAFLNEVENALTFLQTALQQGFVCYPRLLDDPWLNGLRDNAAFKGMLRAAETRHRQAVEAFNAAHGPTVLR